MPVDLALIRSNALIKFTITSANVKTDTLEKTVKLVSKMMQCFLVTILSNKPLWYGGFEKAMSLCKISCNTLLCIC